MIAFKLEGAASDEGLVRFSDFAAFIDGALTTLRALERAETGSRHSRIEYRVTQLEIGSAVLALEPIETPELREIERRIVGRLVEGLSAVRDGLADITTFEPSVREGLNQMLAPLRDGLRSVTATVGDATIEIEGRRDRVFERAQVDEEIAAVGWFSGSVDALNVHGDHYFYLYPPAGPTRIKCIFNPALLDQVKSAVKQYTTVYGLVEYTESSPFPTRIVVDRLEAHPDEGDLPTLTQLWGTAPNLTGDIDEVTYMRLLRDAE